LDSHSPRRVLWLLRRERRSPLLRLPPQPSSLFPYTTLFRSMPIVQCTGRLTAPQRGAHRIDNDGFTHDSLSSFLMSPCRQRPQRSEEHTSELQSLRHLVCRLLLEKKKQKTTKYKYKHKSHTI